MGGRIWLPSPIPSATAASSGFQLNSRKSRVSSRSRTGKRKSSSSRDASPIPQSTTAADDLQAELANVVASKKSLLLAEDNAINQKVMIDMLRFIGFKNVTLTANGTEAANLVRGKPAVFDLVLMDINMPILDG